MLQSAKQITSTRRVISLLSVILLINLSCEDVPTAPPKGNLGLQIDEVGVTTITLRLHAEPTDRPWTIILFRNGETRLQLGPSYATSIDTSITDELLTPNTPYTYQVIYLLDSFPVDSSSPYSATTLNTSNSNFTWQKFYFGDLGSELRDVAIINDTCVWVVGSILKPDTTGSVHEYGLSIWNGSIWNDQLVSYHHFGVDSPYPGPLTSILRLSDTSIYAASPGSLIHWNGTDWTDVVSFVQSLPFTHQILTMWGNGGANIFCGGYGGALYHVAGSTWSTVPTGTTDDITDIWGAHDTLAGVTEIMAIASNRYLNENRLIFSITPLQATVISDSGISVALGSVWFIPGKEYFVSGRDIYSTNAITSRTTWNRNIGSNASGTYKNKIRGTGSHDIVAVCDLGPVLHYDGQSWRNFISETSLVNGVYSNVAISDRTIVAVGYNNGRAVATIGRR